MSTETSKLSCKIRKSLSAGGAVMLKMANPINLFFFILLVVAGLALLNEQIILVGIISTLALLMGAIGAGLLAMIFVGSSKTLSARGFAIFVGCAFILPVTVWSFEIFNTIPQNQWLYVAGLAAIMLICSLYLVPRLRRAYQSFGVMAVG